MEGLFFKMAWLLFKMEDPFFQNGMVITGIVFFYTIGIHPKNRWAALYRTTHYVCFGYGLVVKQRFSLILCIL